MSITTTHEFDIRTDCWGQAERNISQLSDDQIDALEDVIQDVFSGGELPSDTDINDFIWHDYEDWRQWIGVDLYGDDEDEYFDEDEFEEDEFEESFSRRSKRLRPCAPPKNERLESIAKRRRNRKPRR